MTYFVVMVIHHWEDIKLAHNLPFPHCEMKGAPIDGCIGWLAVFDDRAAAEAFAEGMPICSVEGDVAARVPAVALDAVDDPWAMVDGRRRKRGRKEK